MINAVDFDLFGKPRHLKIGLEAMRQIEIKMGGMSLEYLLQNNEKFGYNAITIILSEGLKHEDPTMTVEKVTRNLETAASRPGESLPTVMRQCEAVILSAIQESGLFGDIFEKVAKLSTDDETAELITEPKNEIAETEI